MILEPVAKRYARALFAAADARDLLDRIADDLRAVDALQKSQAEFRRLLDFPRISGDRKRALINELFTGKLHPVVLELLQLLLKKKRLPALGQTIEAYLSLLEAHRGIVTAEVTTARPLPEAYEQRLITTLQSRMGKTVRVEKHIDPAILGGIMVRMDDRIIDRSVRRTFEGIRKQLMDVPLSD